MGNQSSKIIMVAVVMAVVFGGFGYWYGVNSNAGYDDGYRAAEADIQKAQDEAAQRAITEAARVANPFAVNNPLQDVATNPFEEVEQILNPFE
jgi:nitrogen fixation-related uncharacterized protein